MKNKTLAYYAFLDKKTSPGIAKKIDNTIDTARDLGFISEGKVFNAQDKVIFLNEILREKSDYIFIRYPGWISFFLFFILIIKRNQGKKIIIDIPTPRVIGLKEIEDTDFSFFRKTISKILLILAGSWVLWPAHKIVQYADEGTWFSFGLLHKTLKIGNGIKIDSTIPLAQNKFKTECLNLIGVAQLAGWHGYDRLINAVAFLKKKHPDCKVSVKIVGDGAALAGLKSLVKNLKLDNECIFTGLLYGEDLNHAFENAHVAVASLGLHRKGLNEASDLKTREYMARGLCVIGVGKDPDFEDSSPYRFVVPNSDEVEELSKIIYKIKYMQLPEPEDVRAYAQINLTLKSKLEKILNF